MRMEADARGAHAVEAAADAAGTALLLEPLTAQTVHAASASASKQDGALDNDKDERHTWPVALRGATPPSATEDLTDTADGNAPATEDLTDPAEGDAAATERRWSSQPRRPLFGVGIERMGVGGSYVIPPSTYADEVINHFREQLRLKTSPGDASWGRG